MLGENSGQVDVFNNMIFERLIPKDHLLVKIDSIIDFSFVYDKVKDKYSPLGRKSKDPVMMLKILLLEYLYTLSDGEVRKRTQTDSDKKLICDAFRKAIKEIDEEYEKNNKVNLKKYLEIALRYAEYLYLKTYDELQTNEKYKEAFGILWDIIDQYTNNKTDKIVSVVDPEAKIAHKFRGNIKRGYKAYGTVNNRAYLKDKGIISNINFYEESSRDVQYYGIRDFNIPDDLKSATCPNGITTKNCELAYDKSNEKEILRFKFETSVCRKCPLNEKCMRKYDGKIPSGRKVERRFATLVRNHGLRRCRYLKLNGAKTHITLANMACNIIRMVNLLCPPNIAMSNI